MLSPPSLHPSHHRLLPLHFPPSLGSRQSFAKRCPGKEPRACGVPIEPLRPFRFQCPCSRGRNWCQGRTRSPQGWLHSSTSALGSVHDDSPQGDKWEGTGRAQMSCPSRRRQQPSRNSEGKRWATSPQPLKAPGLHLCLEDSKSSLRLGRWSISCTHYLRATGKPPQPPLLSHIPTGATRSTPQYLHGTARGPWTRSRQRLKHPTQC
mmetsp:Transcript_54269/g.118822  ORF Transcript_54269/g.118822 Transcript_54269/m.118822 type:complete len:207 (+) Transcript_54269:671-1291(+)